MSKPEVSYLRKTFKILIANMVFYPEYQMTFHTTHAANQHSCSSHSTTVIRKIFHIHAIDMLHDKVPVDPDHHVTLQLYCQNGQIGTVSFDVSKQKFVKPDSQALFRKPFTNRKGCVDYKFVGMQTELISFEQYKEATDNRNQIYLHGQKSYKLLEKQNMQYALQIIEKDNMIDHLTEKINNLLEQNINLNKKINDQMKIAKHPMNINVNILAKEAKSTDMRLKQLDKLQKQCEEKKQEYDNNKIRISELQVENKRLEENIQILMNQFRDQGFKGDHIKTIEKKMSSVDTLYLLKKSISQFQQKKKLNIKEEPIQEDQNEQQVSGSGSFYFNKPSENLSQNLSFNQGQGVGLFPTFRQQEMKKSFGENSSKQFEKSPNASLKLPSNILTSFAPQMGKDLMSSSKLIQNNRQTINSSIQDKNKHIQMLTKELQKKEETMSKWIRKQDHYISKIHDLEEEKARILTGNALKSIKAGGDQSAEVMMRIKELSIYNTELMKEKQNLKNQLSQLKMQNVKQSKNLMEFEVANRKSLMVMSQMKQQHEVVASAYKELTEGEGGKQLRKLAQNGLQYQPLKKQYIECQTELKELKRKYQDLKQDQQQKEKYIGKMAVDLKNITQEQVSLGLIASKVAHIKRQNQELKKKYQDIDRLQNAVKTFVLKMQSEVYKKAKDTKNSQFEEEMNKIFRQLFAKVNNFESQYYDMLLSSYQYISESIELYYSEVQKLYEMEADTEQKKSQLWTKKAQLFQERDEKIRQIKSKQAAINKKAAKKLYLPEDQYITFNQKLKFIEDYLKQLDSYKVSMLKAVKAGDKIVPTIQIKISSEKLSSQSGDIQRKSSDRSMGKNSGSQSHFFKSQTLLKKSVNPKMLKSSQFRKHNQIVQKQQENFDFQGQLSPHETSRRSSEVMDTLKSKFSQFKELRDSFYNEKRTEIQKKLQLGRSEAILSKDKFVLQQELTKQRMEKKQLQLSHERQIKIKMDEARRQLQAQKLEKDRVIGQYKRRENILEQKAKKDTIQYQIKLKYITKQQEAAIKQVEELTSKLEDKQNEVDLLTKQIQTISSEYQILIKDRNLQDIQIKQLKQLVSEYDQAERMMRAEVLKIRQTHEINEQQMNDLIEQRSEKFNEIQKIKQFQIQKLKRVITELEVRLSQQIQESLHLKTQIEQLKQDNKEIIQKRNTERQQYRMIVINLQEQVNRSSTMMQTLEKENRLYNQNIFQLSNTIEQMEKEEIRLNLVIQNFQKQKMIAEVYEEELKTKQQNLKEDYKKYDYIIQEKNRKIQQLQLNYYKIVQQIKSIEKSTQNTRNDNIRLKEQLENTRDKEFNKQRQIIRIQRQISSLQIQIQKLVMENQEANKQIDSLQIKNQELLKQLEEPKSPFSVRSLMSNKQDLQNKGNQYLTPNIQDKKSQILDPHMSIKKSVSGSKVSKSSQNSQRQNYEIMQIRKSGNNLSEFEYSAKNFEQKIISMQSQNSSLRENIKRPGLLQVRILPHNKSLRLSSLDGESSEVRTSDPNNNTNLNKIDEQRNELQDTFFKEGTQKHKLSEEIGGQQTEYGNEFHHEQIIEQSAIDIDCTYSQIDPKRSVRLLFNSGNRGKVDQRKFEIMRQYEDLQPMDLIGKIIQLQSENEKLRRQCGAIDEEQNEDYSSTNKLDVSEEVVQTPFMGNQDPRNNLWSNWKAVDEQPNSSSRSSKKLMVGKKSSLQNNSVVENRSLSKSSQHSVKNQVSVFQGQRSQVLKRFNTSRSINAADIVLKETQHQLQALQQQLTLKSTKIDELELEMEEKQQQIRELNRSLNQKKQNIELLIQQIKQVTDNNEKLCIERKQLQDYVEKLQIKIRELMNSHEIKCQELVRETMKKDEQLLKLQSQIQQYIDYTEKLKGQLNKIEGNDNNLIKELSVLKKKLAQNKKHYVKYQEQAQLQILKLKEENDELKESIIQLQRQLQIMAEKYIEIQDNQTNLVHNINKQQNKQVEVNKYSKQLQEQYKKAKEELNNVQAHRKQLNSKLKQYERQVMNSRQEAQQTNKQATIELKKHQIKVSQLNQLITHHQQKTKEKECIIIQLKNQIALYNEQTQQLKNANEELQNQLNKAEQQLKQIMNSYEVEFNNIKGNNSNQEKRMIQFSSSIKQKEMQLQFKEKTLKNQDHEIRSLKQDNDNLRQEFQKCKLSLTMKLKDLEHEIALKNDRIQRYENEVCLLRTKIQENKSQPQDHKIQKDLRVALNQLSDDLHRKEEELQRVTKQLEKRPTIERLKQAEFKAALLKNNLEQVQNGHNNQNRKIKMKQDNSQQMVQYYSKQLSKLKQLVVKQQEKSSTVINELKQVIEGYKQLEKEKDTYKRQFEVLRKENTSQMLKMKQLGRLVDELQKQNAELNKIPSVFTSKQSFSKIMTDITL